MTMVSWQGDEPESAKPVHPKDCALCVAIPMTCEDILGRLADPRRFGYVQRMARGRTISAEFSEELLRFYSSQVVVPVGLVCKKLKRLGGKVFLGASLDDVAEAAKQHVVLLWTHWESSRFRDEEITDPDGFVAAADRADTWVRREVREALRPRRWWGLRKGDFGTAVESARVAGFLEPFIAACLNDTIFRARTAQATAFRRALKVGSPWEVPVGPTSGPLITRVLVERDFRLLVGLGRCVETSEGMETAWALLERIPDDRPLVLDMTICNSTEFAELARLPRRRVRVIGHVGPADPASGALLVGRTLDLLADKPRSYLEARALATIELREKLWRQT